MFKNDNEKSTSSSLASTTVPSIIPSTPFLTPPFKSLVEYGAEILNTPNPHAKVSLTNQVAELWKSGKLAISSSTISLPCSSILALPSDAVPPREDLEFTAPSKARKLGGAGTVESRISILHSLASIEQWAIDLAWDIIVRFADYRLAANDDDDDVDDGSSLDRFLPMAFFSDFVKVAADEAKHFSMLINRIKELGSFYGAFPIHGGKNLDWEGEREREKENDGVRCFPHTLFNQLYGSLLRKPTMIFSVDWQSYTWCTKQEDLISTLAL